MFCHVLWMNVNLFTLLSSCRKHSHKQMPGKDVYVRTQTQGEIADRAFRL